jgi:hypothetical protein
MTRDEDTEVIPEGAAYVADPWEGMIDPETGAVYEPPDDDTAVRPEERREVDVSEFWDSRPVLRHLHTFARARRVGPWAVLGAALARVVAHTSPQVQLPPTIGGFASLNLFIGLVGYSGDGKDAAVSVAGEALYIEGPRFKVAPLGSGEGLAHMFMRQGRASKEDPYPEPQQYNRHALVTIPEIDTLGALVARNSSTVTSQLRQAAMGQPLGFHYADASKRMIVPEHQYRLCLIAGIQPERSAVLLSEQAGGTPQRFVWLPAGDPGAQLEVPECPTPLIWREPDWSRCERRHVAGEPVFVVREPDICVQTIVSARVAQQRHERDALDSHGVLTRTKVAAGFALLDGRTDITDEDWSLAGVLMTVSDTQRAVCQRALMKEREKATTAKALEQAEIGIVVEERVDQAKVKKCAEIVRRKLLGAGDWMTHGALNTAVGSRHREYLEPALDALMGTGEVEGAKFEHKGGTGVRYRVSHS